VTTTWLDYRTERGRKVVYVSDLCIVAAGVLFAAAVGRHWSWGPFALGLAVGVLGLGVYAAFLAIATRVVQLDRDELTKARHSLRLRNRIVVPGYVSIGLFCGVVSGSLRSYWLDLVLGLMILIMGLLIPLAVLPLVRRKAVSARQSA
jgi:hypothetical protein